MERIDLHMHSHFSDGTDSPDQLVAKAKSAGIGLIALTDHNTLAGIGDFRAACARRGQAGIDGIELSCAWPDREGADGSGMACARRGQAGASENMVLSEGHSLPASASHMPAAAGIPPEPPEIHVLGYFPPCSDFSQPRFTSLQKAIGEYRLTKIRHNESMVQKMQDAHVASAHAKEGVTVEGFRAFARTLSGSGNYNRVHIARYLVHLGIAASIDDAMDRFIGKKAPYYVPRETITVAQAIEAIHAGGGCAVIAHVGEYRFDDARLAAFFAYCAARGIDGFELLHPHNTPATAGKILAFAKKYRRETGRQLLLTAGSDYHGANKENRQALPWMPPYAWE